MNLIIISAIIVVTAVILSWAILFATLKGGRLLGKAVVAGVLDAIRKSGRDQSLSGVDKRKESLLKTGPKTFYYIDETQVKDLYPQVFQELEPTRIESREREGIRKGIAAKLRFIEPEYARGRTEEITATYDVGRTSSIMYNRVEQYLLENDKITLGLEDFKFEKSSIDEFKSMCNRMQTQFSFNIPDDLRINFVSEKMKEFALKRMKELSSSSGYVVIQTEFSITEIFDEDYLLCFVHPLSEYFPQDDIKVRIQVTCAKRYMSPSGVSTFKKDRRVKITCLGKVVSWNDGDKILEISPIAIY